MKVKSFLTVVVSILLLNSCSFDDCAEFNNDCMNSYRNALEWAFGGLCSQICNVEIIVYNDIPGYQGDICEFTSQVTIKTGQYATHHDDHNINWALHNQDLGVDVFKRNIELTDCIDLPTTKEGLSTLASNIIQNSTLDFAFCIVDHDCNVQGPNSYVSASFELGKLVQAVDIVDGCTLRIQISLTKYANPYGNNKCIVCCPLSF